MHNRRPSISTIFFVFILLLTICLFAGTAPSAHASAVTYTSEETALLQLINEYRLELGLNPLKVSDRLSEAGDRHGLDMATYGFFGHYTVRSDWFAEGATPWDRMTASGYDYNTYKGENIAAGQLTATEVFNAWKNSPSHNEHMVDANYRVIGVSLIYVGGSTYKYYWITDFGGYADQTAHSLTPSGSGGTGTGTGTGFSDVTSATRYADQIMLLAKRGVVSGYSDGTFGPYDQVTRQQFAKMIVLSLGYAVSPISACSFEDVSSSVGSADPLYPAAYVQACVARGITLGKTPSMFYPYDSITRAQLITMAARAAGLDDPPSGYRPSFSDFSAEHYQWARRAAYAGWLDGFAGMGPSFDFWAPATRGEVCLLLAALLQD